uniref:SAP domain-containing protein n=1 Tax=Guillardia theta TaxID=55529 RepID=A0A7S4NPM6_GUITH|mmetsp:Transcript_27277/g.89065  ORF Transcript_27277/g.89065 Transcript_27277/m.89065 type:complete len:219 (+) Transcript_27277:3-659(+)
MLKYACNAQVETSHDALQLSRSEMAHKIKILHSLERKGSVLMSGKHTRLPSQMSTEEIREELQSRRIGIKGSRYELERRLEEAWLKEGERFDQDGEDGYAFGRWAVSAREVIETMSDIAIFKELAVPARKKWVEGKLIAPRSARIQLLEEIYAAELQERKIVAFDLALNEMLEVYKLETAGPKPKRFQRLVDYFTANPFIFIDNLEEEKPSVTSQRRR